MKIDNKTKRAKLSITSHVRVGLSAWFNIGLKLPTVRGRCRGQVTPGLVAGWLAGHLSW